MKVTLKTDFDFKTRNEYFKVGILQLKNIDIYLNDINDKNELITTFESKIKIDELKKILSENENDDEYVNISFSLRNEKSYELLHILKLCK